MVLRLLTCLRPLHVHQKFRASPLHSKMAPKVPKTEMRALLKRLSTQLRTAQTLRVQVLLLQNGPERVPSQPQGVPHEASTPWPGPVSWTIRRQFLFPEASPQTRFSQARPTKLFTTAGLLLERRNLSRCSVGLMEKCPAYSGSTKRTSPRL